MRLALHAEPEAAPARRPLRFLTAGSVDDGKSTLIGRLLLDGRAILADQLDALAARAGGDGRAIDLALLTDGLEAEREQGITIDVAYRYFATTKRKFIIADAPGHEQYTRNMVTAAAGSDAAVVLVDATKLDLEATSLALCRRRAATRFSRSCCACRTSSSRSTSSTPSPTPRRRSRACAPRSPPSLPKPGSIPPASCRSRRCTATTSAGRACSAAPMGRRCSRCSKRCPRTRPAKARRSCRCSSSPMPPATAPATGRACSGAASRAARSRAAPSSSSSRAARRARVAELHAAGGRVAEVGAGRSAGVVLDRQLDVSRGDWLAAPGSIAPSARFRATLAWLDHEPAIVGRKYWLRHGNRWLQGRIAAIESRLDVATLAAHDAAALAVNDIGTVVVETQQPLPLARFADDRVAGALIVVDPATHRTSGTLLVRESLPS